MPAAVTLIMTAAAVITADMILSMLMIVMAARRILAGYQRAGHQRRDCLVASALYARIKLDAESAQRILCAAADAAADQRIHTVHHQHAGQRAVTTASSIEHL